MISRIVLFFIGTFTLSICTSPPPIDYQALQDVFGTAAQYSGQAVQAVQAVTPVAENEVESDDFNPPPIDYDSFDWTLTRRVASSTPENFLLSPLGLKLALAILTEAATGITRTELSYVLGFTSDQNATRQKFTSIIESLQKESPQYILNLGSRIYVGDSVRPKQMFAAIAEEFYKTELRPVEFTNPPAAAHQINSWVSNITHGKIPKLVNHDDVSGLAVMVLNVLYFKGSWRNQFGPNATKPGQFYTSPRSIKEIPFMNVNDKFYYAESSKFDAKILRMAYLGNKFAMYIIVPNSLQGLPRVLDNINFLRSELDNLRQHYVDVTFPKFKFDYTSHLGGILKELGVRQAFEDSASFPGIARAQQEIIKISKILQRSGIDNNELGSVAYAATEIALENKFGEDIESQVEVVANRPFLFFIQDEVTRQLLITGRLTDPSEENGAL